MKKIKYKKNKALELKPDYAVAYNNKGYVLDNLGKYEEAIVALDKAIALDSKYAFAYSCKGDPFQGEGKYDEALKEYNKAIALDPNFQEALDNKNAALEAIARQASERDFEILLKNTPLSPVARKVAEKKIASLKGRQGSNDGDRRTQGKANSCSKRRY